MTAGNQAFKPEELFEGVASFVEDSRALIEKGALVELAGLDSRVQELCEAVLRLSQEERLRYADRLQQLLSDLGALGETLAAQRDLVAGEIRSASTHKKASVAYRIVESIDGGKKEEDKNGN